MAFRPPSPLFDPQTVAVIGASAQGGKVGHDVLKNLVTQGYAGAVYPVNPKGGEILGKTAFKTVGEIPGTVDMAVIVTPAPTVAGLLRECAAKQIGTVVVITAGFGETGTEEGRKAEEEIRTVARDAGIRMIGANCLGMLRPSLGLNASFAKDLPPAGNVALISQSGALAVALMDAAPAMHLGFSVVASIGNKTVLDECDYLEACEADPKTAVIGLYLESIKDGQRFRTLAERITKKKPIVLLKSGTSARGRAAVSSHTGSLAGADGAISAVCRQAGIHRAADSDAFLDLLRVLSTQPPLLSDGVCVLTNAGGPGILATDACERHGLLLATPTEKTMKTLALTLPLAASAKNPVDVLGDAGADRYVSALNACLEDPGIDGAIALLTPQAMTPCEAIAEGIAQASKTFPLVPVTACFMGGETVRSAIGLLAAAGIPAFPSPERAVRALSALRRRPDRPATDPPAPDLTRAKNAQDLLRGMHGLLSPEVSEKLCALYGIPLPPATVAVTEDDAVRIARELSYPVIAKISARDIVHKTDVGGVRANLQSEEDVRRAYAEILATVRKNVPNACIDGVLIQRFLPAGNEFIIGGLRDAAFGPLVLAGLGGIYTELFRDSAMRLGPLSRDDAYAMLQELTSWRLLLGMRGAQQSDIDGLVDLILSVSTLVVECPQIVEMDLNPVIVTPRGIVVADVKIVLTNTEA